MPIHSIISEYDIFACEKPPSVVTKQVKGGWVEMVKGSSGYSRRRLISTDQKLYLKPEYQPTRFYT